jgi:hypothetical protein
VEELGSSEGEGSASRDQFKQLLRDRSDLYRVFDRNGKTYIANYTDSISAGLRSTARKDKIIINEQGEEVC